MPEKICAFLAANSRVVNQALVFHHLELANLVRLVVQAARIWTCGNLLCGYLLLRQGFLLGSQLRLLGLQVCHLLVLSGILLRRSLLLEPPPITDLVAPTATVAVVATTAVLAMVPTRPGPLRPTVTPRLMDLTS